MAKEIQSIQIPCDVSGNPADYVVGRQGVTKIISTERNGEYCMIPYIEVWAGNDLLLEACQHKVAFVCFVTPNREQQP